MRKREQEPMVLVKMDENVLSERFSVWIQTRSRYRSTLGYSLRSDVTQIITYGIKDMSSTGNEMQCLPVIRKRK